MTPPKLCQTKNGIYYVYINRKKTYLGKCSKRVAETRYRNFLSKLYSSDNASVVVDAKDGVTISELVAAFMTARLTTRVMVRSTSNSTVSKQRYLFQSRSSLSYPSTRSVQQSSWPFVTQWSTAEDSVARISTRWLFVSGTFSHGALNRNSLSQRRFTDCAPSLR